MCCCGFVAGAKRPTQKDAATREGERNAAYLGCPSGETWWFWSGRDGFVWRIRSQQLGGRENPEVDYSLGTRLLRDVTAAEARWPRPLAPDFRFKTPRHGQISNLSGTTISASRFCDENHNFQNIILFIFVPVGQYLLASVMLVQAATVSPTQRIKNRACKRCG